MIQIQIRNSKDGQFFVRYIGRNGKILASTETLKTHANAIKNIIAMSAIFRVDSKQPIKIKDFTIKPAKEIVI